MDERSAPQGSGCGRRLGAAVALLWLAAAPVVSTLLVNAVVGDRVGPEAGDGIAILLTGLALIVPFVGLARSLSRRPSGDQMRATASSLAIVSGYVVLDAAIRLALPSRQFLVPLRSRYLVAALRTVILVPYAVLAARLGPRWAGISQRPTQTWLRLGKAEWAIGLLSLAAAALVTLPWPVTGALGDSLASLALTAQLSSLVVSQVLIFWGVIFVVLTSTFSRTEGAAVTTILIYLLSAFGGVLTRSNWGAVTYGLFLVPLAFLLTELRARGGGVLALMPLALCYPLIPQLFVDPRDALAQGIPEVQHVISYLVVALAAMTLGFLLWLGRRARKKRDRGSSGAAGRRRASFSSVVAVAAVLSWGLWAGLYLFAGEPGFFNHGFLIILEEQANLESARGVDGREARLEAVRQALVETAEESQGPVLGELDARNVPYRRYYVMNMVRVDGHRWLMEQFAARSGVRQVILNPNVRIYPRRIPLPYGGGASSPGVQANLAAVRADEAWELGVRGSGIVVGGQDTGYDWDHPALKPHYRGWDGEGASHDYNWHDAWADTREPFDDGSHGTHTMGIVLGDDGRDNRTGVAPEAAWIGCRNMRRGIGNPGSYAECMEFLFAPYPLGGDSFRDGDVRRGAHVTNNSWGCPWMEGCFSETLRPAVDALRAAGIMTVVSAGNDGPACSTATTPPANYDGVFTVGATTNEGGIVGFSSRGPAHGLIKPDIAAPGRQIRSSVPGGAYATASGTSMAAPHVAGAVALVWSAEATMIGEVEATEALLCRTGVPKPVSQSCEAASAPEGPLTAAATTAACACGGVQGAPNNVYGCGMLDAGAAVERVLEE